MTITSSSIPLEKDPDCGEIQELCGPNQNVSRDIGDVSVVYPPGEAILTGGSIIKVDIKNLKIEPTVELTSIVDRDLTFSRVFNKSLKGLVEYRNAVNAALLKVKKIKAVSGNKKVKAPDIYISYADDYSKLSDNVASTSVDRACYFNYIPLSGLKKLLGQSSFVSDVYGASGKKFSEISLGSEDGIRDALIDLFPIFNIENPDKNVLGGYYTVFDGFAYIKLPNLTFKDSAGFGEGLDKDVFLEVCPDESLFRRRFDYAEPIYVRLVEQTGGFGDDVEVTIQSNVNLNNAHLSLIVPHGVGKEKSLNLYSNGIELYTVPALDKPSYGLVGNGTVSGLVDQVPQDYIDEQGYNIYSYSNTSFSSVFGEFNRPDILLANRDLKYSTNKNDKKFFRQQAAGLIPLLASHRPAFYEVPSQWISTNTRVNVGDAVRFRFAKDLFKLNAARFVDNVEFALYVSSGAQIVRVPGVNISLDKTTPSITGVSPDGFSGSLRIDIDYSSSIQISGEGLANSKAIRINDIQFSLEPNSIFTFDNSSDTSIVINFVAPLSSYGILGGINKLVVINESGQISTEVDIYVSLGSEALPDKQLIQASFDNEMISVIGFGNSTPYGIPLAGNIKLKSRRKIFSGDYDLYAYVALENTPENLELANKITPKVKLVGDVLALDLPYRFSAQSNQAFSRVNNSKAVLNLSKLYGGYNLEQLYNLDNAYLLFTGHPITGVDVDNYYLMPLGTDISAFIDVPYVKGIYVSSNGGYRIGKESDYVNSIVGLDFKKEDIKVFKKIDEMYVLFAGSRGDSPKRQYSFSLVGDGVNEKISPRSIVQANKNELVAYFKNIVLSEQGDFEVRVEKSDDVFDVDISSKDRTKGISFMVEPGEFEILGGKLNLIAEKNLDGLDLLPDGLVSGDLVLYNNADIVPSMPVSLKDSMGKVIDVVGLTFLTNVQRYSLLINTGVMDVYQPAGQNNLVTIKSKVNSNSVIGMNKPIIVSVSKDKNSKPVPIDTEINISAGQEVDFYVKSSERNFVILINSEEVKPSSIVDMGNVYKATITVPTIVVDRSCIEICSSITNSERNKAELELNPEFVFNIDTKMEDTLYGNAKESIPSASDLSELLSDKHLRFLQFKLDKSNVPKDLINSFCDYSFHLTADLKIALNGLQSLMIPVQVIFAIIDVICSLVNPIKIGRAVLKLFQVLYDLLMMLPAMSVPVMLLQLILHMLELLKCISGKVLFKFTAINKILVALNNAHGKSAFKTIQSLEEVLSEYLFEIEADLQVLEPVVTILAIFLELLQLTFQFPCSVSPNENDPACGLDGTLLVGIVSGLMVPGDYIDAAYLVPVNQAYTTETIEAAATSVNGSAPYIEVPRGAVVATKYADETYYNDMNVNQENLRASGAGFNPTFAVSITKARKASGSPKNVKFVFNGRGRNGTFKKRKIVDPMQTIDDPLILMAVDGSSMTVANARGGMISPIDGYSFLTDSGTSVKPLTLDFELPIYEVNADGEVFVSGFENVTRTFDNIPSLVIVDEEFNLYFIDVNGIEYDKDNQVKSIRARVQNKEGFTKFKFAKEEEEVDTDDDGVNDDTADIFDLPQIYFFDMRQAEDHIQQYCFTSSINSFPLDNNDSIDDIADLAEDTLKCVNDYLKDIKTKLSSIRGDINTGVVPKVVDLMSVSGAADNMESCLEDIADDLCIYVLNTLSTSVLMESSSGDIDDVGLDMIGAREFASGIGDMVVAPAGTSIRTLVIPRDGYNMVMSGDYSEKIIPEIVLDTTDGAYFERVDGKFAVYDGTNHYIFLRSDSAGTVKFRVKICNRIIQAATYAGTEYVDVISDSGKCIPTAPDVTETIQLGELVKIDRVLTAYFVNDLSTNITHDNTLPVTTPQVFGSSLEN